MMVKVDGWIIANERGGGLPIGWNDYEFRIAADRPLMACSIKPHLSKYDSSVPVDQHAMLKVRSDRPC